LNQWVGDQRPHFASDPPALSSSPLITSAEVKLSQAALKAQAADAQAQDNDLDPRMSLLKIMVEAITGKRIHLFKASDIKQPAPAGNGTAVQPAPPPKAGFGVEYDMHESYSETEQTHVSASGTIKTADGREISFQLDLSMSRSYAEQSNISLRAGDGIRKDPLVLNFGGTAAELSDQKFSFDLDGDGDQEQVSQLSSATGYLALDKNGNGRIDSGKELFGPQTNSGMGELAALDSDKNGWIDENDAAFSQLKVWVPDGKGDGKLMSLQEAGVGALALAHVNSQFELRGNGNSNLGAVKDTGLFLFENGQVGSLQEIDLTV
jgi:hypothetical protein